MKQPIVITLEDPIKANGETLSELTLKRPKVKHLKAMDAVEGDIEKAIALISSLAAIPPSSVEEMDATDFAKCSEAVEVFIKKKYPKTGSRSSRTSRSPSTGH